MSLIDKKGLSEAALIQILFYEMLSPDDTMEDKEKLSRWCLAIHKDFYDLYSRMLAEKEEANKVLPKSFC